ncbi:MAG: ABC transporter permease subunit [Ruminiclostridium sp.]|nr:ABC transporter permease subunit [Ruminiclostridium sp.]
MRKNTKKVDIIIIAVILLLIAGGIMLAFLSDDDRPDVSVIAADTNGDGTVTYIDYAGKTIGVGTGSMFDVLVEKNIPGVKLMYFNTYTDMVTALESGKVDAVCVDEPVIKYIMSTEDHAVDYLDEPIEEYNYGFAFPKTEAGKKLRDKFNEFLKKIKTDGTLREMENKWFSPDKSGHTLPEINNQGAEHGVLRLAVEALITPFAYLEGNRIVGYEVDIAYSFCKEYGYGLEVTDMSFNAIIPALNTGMSDFGCSSMNITEERAESVYFSEPDYVAGAVLAVRSSDVAKNSSAVTADMPISYFGDKRIGILTGSAYEPVAQKVFPDAEYMYFDVASDLALAAVSGKIDGYLMASDQAETMIAENPELFWLKEAAEDTAYAFAFPKTENGAVLRDKINAFLKKIKADGTMDALLKKWTEGEIEQSVDLTGFTGENGVLSIACDGTTPPWEYTYNGEVTGYEIELVAMFCREYGYIPDFDTMTFSAVIPGISTEKYDMAAANISVTAERAESVYFSDKESGSTVVFVTAAVGAESPQNAGNVGFLDSIVSSFEKNFIREDRWKLILEGIGTTCFITVMSALLGSVLAFLVCMFRRTGSRLANAISNIYVKLLQGTPVVVLLMILYYVILGKSGLEAVWVAIIGFTLNFGAYASEVMRSGIESIDGGQREAALALGYNENQAFFRFIFPQAAVRFLPVYKQEIVSLLKSTSIVGYIAIQDLTKMSDIIRSRTYEAFFPLIATAIIYFILAWVISLILKLVMKAFDRRHTARTRRKKETFRGQSGAAK